MVERIESIQQEELLFRSTQGAPIFNAWFFRRVLFEKFGLFDNCFLYAADRDFLIRMVLRNIQYHSINLHIYNYRIHPASFTFNDRDNGESEVMFEFRNIAEHNLQRAIPSDYKKIIRIWHSQITSDQTITALKNFAFGRSSNYIVRGMRYNKAWPMIFLDRMVHRTIQFIKRRVA